MHPLPQILSFLIIAGAAVELDESRGNWTAGSNSSVDLGVSRVFPNSAQESENSSTNVHLPIITPLAIHQPLNSSALVNSTRKPDLKNATECFMYEWEWGEAYDSWYEASTRWSTFTTAYQWARTKAVVPVVSIDETWTTSCDGLVRFRKKADAERMGANLSFTTFLTTSTRTVRGAIPGEFDMPQAQCTVNGPQECLDIGSMVYNSVQSSLESWSSAYVLTISVAKTPTLLVVNGQPTPLTAPSGQLPPLPLRGRTFPASPDGKWSIHPAYSAFADTTISPGQEVTFTFSNPYTDPAVFAWNMYCPFSEKVDEEACSTKSRCTIQGVHVELMYFPPPSTTRDMCAITSSGFDRYSQSIYSHPHVSTVINSTTFWMDKAYLRYNTVSAFKLCSVGYGRGYNVSPVGGTYTDAYVEIESKDASTMCGVEFNPVRPYGKVVAATPYPLNFDDLNGHVPLSAYLCQLGQDDPAFVVEDHYFPQLAVPLQVRALDPEWAECVPYFAGTPDPPIALSSVAFLTEDGPTPTPLPATPGKSVPTGHPISTANPAHPEKPLPDPSPKAPPQNTQKLSSHSGQGANIPHLKTSFTATIVLPTPRPGDRSNSPSDPRRPTNQPERPPITVIGGQPIFTEPSQPGNVIIGRPGEPFATTITPGSPPVFISGTRLSVVPSGTGLLITGPVTLQPIARVNGEPIFIDPANPGQVIIGDPAASATLQTVSLTNGSAVFSGTTISVSPQDAQRVSTDAARPITTTIVGLSMSVLPEGLLVINSINGKTQTLAPGAPQISVDGHTIFFGLDHEIVVDGQVYTFEQNGASGSDGAVVIIGGDGHASTYALSRATATHDTAAELESVTSAVKEKITSSGETDGNSSGETSVSTEFRSSIVDTPTTTSQQSRASLPMVNYEFSALVVSLSMICALWAVLT